MRACQQKRPEEFGGTPRLLRPVKRSQTMHIKRISGGLPLLLALGVLFSPLAAQETADIPAPVRLNPNEAVDRAIKNNLSLESARISSSTKKRASDLSWNQFIPNVTIGGSLIMDNEKTTVTGMAPVPWKQEMSLLGWSQNEFERVIPGVGTMYNWVMPYSVEASQWHVAGSIQASLTISIAMFENMNRLRLDYQGGLVSYEKAKAQLERDVRKAYNSMVLLRENINLLKENVEAAGRRVQMAQANYRAGLAPELSLLQAQVAMENLKPVIDQAENGFRLSMAQFAMFLGLPYNTPFELEPVESETGFISLDVKELISKAVSGKPDIQELRHSILMLQSARKAQFYSLLPSLSLNWNTTPAFLGDPWKDNLGDNDMWRKSGSLTISLGLRLHSLIPFSMDFQGIKNMDDQIRIANTGLAQMIYGTEIEVYNTVLSLDKTRISAEAQAQTVSLAERAYRLTEQAYSAGLQDLLQVQNAELELKQAKVSMLEQQFNYLNSLIDLEYSIGVPYGTLSSGSPGLKGE
jgi:outer membrane protein TolC